MDKAFIKNDLCICELGYNGTESCELIDFSLAFVVNSDNSLNLTFSDNLLNIISSSDLTLEIENVEDFTWTMERMSDSNYFISISSNEEIKQDNPIIVNVLDLNYLVSANNGLLQTNIYFGILNSFSPTTQASAIDSVSAQTSAAVQTAMGGVLAVSMLNPNPASFWTLLNTLQIVSFLGVSKIPMSEKMFAFIKNLNGLSIMPNPLEWILDKDSGTAPYPQAVKYGYDTDLFLVNAGQMVLTLAVTVAIWPLLSFLASCSYRKLGK